MAIDKIIIENFKAFKGQHIFDLKELNIFTGANNSGKSTLIKAISLFSKGLENGDFPSIDLFETNSGTFKDLVNRDSGANSFKIGFFIELGKDKLPFKVMYEFVDGEGSYKSSGSAQFHRMVLKDTNDKEHLVVQNAETYDDSKTVNNHNESYPIKSLMADNNPAQMFVSIYVNTFNEIIETISNEGYGDLICHFEKHKENDGYWWSEHFIEDDFDYFGIQELRIEDLIYDIYKDEFRNLGDYDIKKTLLFGDGNEDDVLMDYNHLREKLRYSDFIKKVYVDIFDRIEKGLELFRTYNFEHIFFQNYKERIITKGKGFDFLFSLYKKKNDQSGFNNFTKKALDIFKIDGYIELKIIRNAGMEINLVTDLSKTDDKISEERRKEKREKETQVDVSQLASNAYLPSYFVRNYSDTYKNNPRQNIVELGKGMVNLIMMVIKIFHIIDKYQSDKWKNKELAKLKGNDNNNVAPKLFLIEEPEAFLHPDWQTKLADFFAYCINYTKKGSAKIDTKFIIETHSVYFIQRLQLLVAQKELPKDSLNVLFFNELMEKEKFYKMNLRDDGIFIDEFGKGFYDEIARNTIDLLNVENKN